MKKTLYLGLELPSNLDQQEVVHCPLITTVARPQEHAAIAYAFDLFERYTHIIFTSKTTVSIFFNYANAYKINLEKLSEKKIIAVGTKTSRKLRNFGIDNILTASQETSEGVIELLKTQHLMNAHIFWPHSALSRPVLSDWLQQENITYHECIFYDTIYRIPEHFPDVSQFDEIIFTSPSTVKAFYHLFGGLPADKILTAIGPVTQQCIIEFAKFVPFPQ